MFDSNVSSEFLLVWSLQPQYLFDLWHRRKPYSSSTLNKISPVTTPVSTNFFVKVSTHCFVDFIPFNLGLNLPESRITRDDGEDFS